MRAVSGTALCPRPGTPSSGRHGDPVGTPGPLVSARRIAEGLDFSATSTSCINVPSVDEVRCAMGPVRIAGSETVFAWKGKLDDVRVYNRALIPADVAQLYACAP